jgi:hypothetical protein
MSAQIAQRLCVGLAQRGSTGKSTFASCVSLWSDHHGVTWRGFDLDPDHRSFSRWFPSSVKPVDFGMEPLDDVVKVLRGIKAGPITLLDLRAHMSSLLLDALEITRFATIYAETGGRITVAFFPADDLAVMDHMDSAVSRLGDSVDYIVVRNMARAPRTRMLDGSSLESELARLGAGFVELPTLLATARNSIAAKEVELGRGITLVEAVANKELGMDPLLRLVIESWLRTVFRRLDGIAHLLLPSTLAQKIASSAAAEAQPAKPASARGARLNLKAF